MFNQPRSSYAFVASVPLNTSSHIPKQINWGDSEHIIKCFWQTIWSHTIASWVLSLRQNSKSEESWSACEWMVHVTMFFGGSWQLLTRGFGTQSKILRAVSLRSQMPILAMRRIWEKENYVDTGWPKREIVRQWLTQERDSVKDKQNDI